MLSSTLSLLFSTASLVVLTTLFPSSAIAVPFAAAPASPRDFHMPEKRVIAAGKRRFMRKKRSSTCGSPQSEGANGGKVTTTSTANYDYGYSNSTATSTGYGADSTATSTGYADDTTTSSTPGNNYYAPASSSKHHHTTSTSTSEPAQSSSSGSGGGSSGDYLSSSGYATYFYQGGNAGNCGQVNPDSAMIVALATSQYNNGANCGKTVKITAANGQTQTATVADSCPPCEAGHIDMSEGLFKSFGYDLSAGVFDITWECEGCTW